VIDVDVRIEKQTMCRSLIKNRLQEEVEGSSMEGVVDELEAARPIDAEVRIGHVHLKVADLERSLRFYCGVLGFELMQRYGGQAAFVSAGGYHHHIGLNTWDSLGGSPPPRR
jgi:catechol-2,3-dioxygenase